MTVIIAFQTGRGHGKQGYCSNNHTCDHLVMRNIWLKETYKVQQTIAFSFLIQKADPRSNSSYTPISFSQRNKETRRSIKAGQRTESNTWGAWGHRQHLFLIPGGPLVALWHVPWWANNHLISSELWLLMGDREHQPWGEGERSAFETRSWGMAGPHCCLQLPTHSWSQGRSPHVFLQKVRKEREETGQKLSCLSLLPPHLGQILASSREQEWWTSISLFAAMLFKAPASFPLCFGQPEVVKIN